MSAEWLLVGGEPFVDGLVLSHPEQVDRLREACPQALDAAVLGGDPCFDRMLAARPHRERFRRALGVRSGQRLVVLNSTWNPEGFFGNGGDADLLPGLLPRLGAELPADEYRVVAVLHPNVWFGHGPGQVRAWLDGARRAGLTLIDPVRSWRQALVAADLVVGDFGAVSYYAAALGLPVLIAADGAERLDPQAPPAAFVREAPRFDAGADLARGFHEVIAKHRPLPGPAEFTTSAPGGSAGLLRRHFYALLGLPEPAAPALLEPLPLPPHEPPRRTAPYFARTLVSGAEVTVERSTAHPYGAGGASRLLVHEDTLDPEALESADLITREGPAEDPRFGGPEAWTAEVLRRYPHCAAAAWVTGPDACVVRVRSHGLFRLAAAPGADADPPAYAVGLAAWLDAGRPSDAAGAGAFAVRVAGRAHPVLVEADRPEA
ncbi:hypothetical protein ACN20G_12985 [Streptomyces sp. BI20]|uniref:hypothetical protein n=1 Tax=Streptomyces sp. BI20 TaxID=3403460 RepID=UPI003C75A97C